MGEQSQLGAREATRTGSQWMTGLILITIGCVAMIGQLTESVAVGTMVPLAIGLVFLAVGIASRQAGFMVPAGNLLGVGLGVLLVKYPLFGWMEDAKGGVFLVCFGAGFALVTLLSILFTAERHWWALIPGGILMAIGAALVIGEGAVRVTLHVAPLASPVAFICVGLVLILRALPRMRD